MERWARREPYGGQSRVLALRRVPSGGGGGGEGGEGGERDCLLLLVGVHFALVVDRPQPHAHHTHAHHTHAHHTHTHAHARTHALSLSTRAGAGGGGAAFVDQLLSPTAAPTPSTSAPTSTSASTPSTPSASDAWGCGGLSRFLAEQYLSLEGSYGTLYDIDDTDVGAGAGAGVGVGAGGGGVSWRVRHSTLPWLEGSSLFGGYRDTDGGYRDTDGGYRDTGTDTDTGADADGRGGDGGSRGGGRDEGGGSGGFGGGGGGVGGGGRCLSATFTEGGRLHSLRWHPPEIQGRGQGGEKEGQGQGGVKGGQGGQGGQGGWSGTFSASRGHCYGVWEVLECDYSRQEVCGMLGPFLLDTHTATHTSPTHTTTTHASPTHASDIAPAPRARV
ncbi:hypothetical protein B484DRAFT_78378 [Ochromonadaceae sp. CCMP2298]|nr:hypothetical protein B484DRAFT_78378 [Ochromonadaceae sp. CCMP2298]